MSADNWTICPKCKKRDEPKTMEDVRRLYKLVSAKEYEAALKTVGKPGEFANSLREDFELGIINDEFYVIYTASCECGYSFEFKHSEKVP